MIPTAKLINWINMLPPLEPKENIAISDDGRFLEIIGPDGNRTGSRIEIGTWSNEREASE